MKVLVLFDENLGLPVILGLYATMNALLLEYPGNYEKAVVWTNGGAFEFECIDKETMRYIEEWDVK